MRTLDKDLASIQEVRDLLTSAKKAQHTLAKMSQAQIDQICAAIAQAAYNNREKLAKMASEETGFGLWRDKIVKNSFASMFVWDSIKEMKTVGVLKEDREKRIIDIAVPVGVVAGLIPSTNPTSTVIYKALISLKAGNAIVFSPHPNALCAILETIKIISQAAEQAGCPKGAIGCMEKPTMQGTAELMKHHDTDLILATGGTAMVKAAYSSGTPAIGVGPGNGPAYIEKSADIPLAVKRILDSKTFDNGTICASEQSIIAETGNKEKVINELKKQGAYFLSKTEAEVLGKYIMRANGSMNPQIVGKSVQTIAKLTGLTIPKETRVLIAEETKVGPKVPYSREKLAPILAFYTVDNWEAACELSMDILYQEGAGHTMMIHSNDDQIIREFGLKKPVSRLLVNTAGALGGIGATTNLAPALTIGCGAVGGSSTSDNISPENLFNVRRIAYGVRELEDLRDDVPVSTSYEPLNEEKLVDTIVERILAKLQ